MLLHSGRNWIQNLFWRMGWLNRQKTRAGRCPAPRRFSASAAECARFGAEDLEQRTLLSTITVTSLADTLNAGAGSGVTLRDAIQAANTDTSVDGSVAGQANTQNLIVFQASLNGTISLALGQMTISSTMEIDGLGAANTVINAQQNSRIFNITSAAGDVTIGGMTLENGKTTAAGRTSAGGAGGAIFSAETGTLTLSADVISGNSTTGNQASGGAVFAEGPVTIVNSTLSGNSTTGPNAAYGGAIYSAAAVTFMASTLSGNSTSGIHSYGGALFSFGDIQLTNSTVTGNNTTGTGSNAGAIWAGAALTATNSTIALNSAANGQSGGMYQWTFDPNPTITLKNSIVAQNTDNGTSPDLKIIGRATVTLTHSLIGNNAGSGLTEAPVGSADGNGNLIGGPVHGLIDPKLGALASNGGPTQTMALLAGSPAIDAGDNNVAISAGLTTDQRGAPYYRIAGAAVDMGAFESQTLSLVVTSTADVLHSTFNNPANETLRDALYIANHLSGGGTITFDPTVFPIGTLTTITLGGMALELSNTAAPVTISGPGAGRVAVSGAGLSRVFVVDPGVTVAIDGLTVMGGSAAQGGGIYNSGNLTVGSDTISGNQAAGSTGTDGVNTGDSGGAGGDGLGGGIYDAVGAALTVQNSTFSGNNAIGGAGGSGVAGLNTVGARAHAGAGGAGGQGGQGLGGAIYCADGSNSFSVSSTTFSGNSAQGGAGGAGGSGGNNDPVGGSFGDASHGGDGGAGGIGGQAQGGAIYAATVSITDSSFSTNAAEGGAGGVSASGGGSGTFYLPAGYGGTGGAGGAGGLAAGGGLFVSGSFSIDGSTLVSNTALGGSGSAGSSGGHGAYYGGLGGTGGAGAMGAGGGIASEGTSGSVTNTTLSGNQANGGHGADGGSAGSSGGNSNWNFGSGTAGDGGSGQGGAIYNASTCTLTVTASTLDTNQAAGNNGGNSPATLSEQGRGGSGGKGGAALGAGIANPGTLDLTNSTLASNTATGGNGGNGSTNSGGGGSPAVGGDAGAAVGGIYNAGTVLAIFDTLALNHGSTGSPGAGPAAGGNAGSSTGGFEDGAGTAQIEDTIIAKNTAPNSPDVSGTVSLSTSLVGDNTGSGLTEAPVGSPDGFGNLIGGTTHGRIDPLLGTLGNNGGPTQTMALLAGSPAAGAGVIVNDVNSQPVTTDQRGNTRFAGVVDLGAYQSPTIASISRFTPANSPTNATSVTFTVTFHEPVQNVAAGDFTVNVGSIGVTPVNSSTYHVDVTGLNGFDGTLTLGFAANQTITDAIGNALINTTPSGDNVHTYVVDTDTPTAPTVNSLITNNHTPTITGTLAAESTVLTVNVHGTTYTLGSSSQLTSIGTGWTLNLTGTTVLADGQYTVTVHTADAAGNNSDLTATNVLTIDTVTPTAPTVNSLVTNNPTPTITGTFAAEPTVLTVNVNGTTYTLGSSPQLTSDGAGNWKLALTATIPDGFYNVVVHTADATGYVIDLTAANALIVNTVAPAPTAFSGAYAVSTNGSLEFTLASITQNGSQLTLQGSTTNTATVTSTTHLQVAGTIAVYGDSQITFGSTGPFAHQVWTKLDLPANYTTARGTATHVNTNGNSIIFVDENGVQSAGTWINSRQLTAFGQTVTVGNGLLMFSNGTIWYENVSLPGTLNGAGSTNLSARPIQFTVLDFTNLSGTPVHVIETGTTQVVFVDGLGRMSLGSFINDAQATVDLFSGDVATFTGGIVVWHDGSLWLPAAAPSPQVTVTDYTNQNGVATHVIRNGTANLAFVDGLGQFSLGTFINSTQATGNAYPGGIATFAANSVSWQDGFTWTRTGTLTGAGITNSSQFTVVDYTNLAGTAVHLVRTGTSELVFIDGLGRISLGSFIDATHATADLYPGDTATFVGNTIFWHDGSLWIPSATPSPQVTVTDFTNQNGVATHIIRNGTANLAFVDGLGQFSLGTFINSTQATCHACPSDIATFAGTTVTWQDGTVWTRNGLPPITITATDANGAVSHLRLLSPATLVGVDGVLQGVHGTRLNGKIFWTNGQTWDNLNFNALNAFFEMATGYP